MLSGWMPSHLGPRLNVIYIYIYIYMCVCAPLARNHTFLQKHRKPFFLFGSLKTAQNLKKTFQNPQIIPSLLSAHAGIYTYCIKNTNIDALRLNAVTPGAQAERNIYIYIYICICVCPSCTKPCFFLEMCAPLARNHTFLQKHRKPHAWIREQFSKSAHLPDPTHAGTKYPVRGNPSLRLWYLS